MSRFGLLVVVLAGCATLSGTREVRREVVQLHPSSTAKALLYVNDEAALRCPLEDLLRFADDPRPLAPWHERLRGELIAELWRAEARRVAVLFESSDEILVSPKDRGNYELIGELLHAGLCSVRNLDSGKCVSRIVVVSWENSGRGGRGAAWGRRFEFDDGAQFFTRLDGMS